ncbi:MAG: hypothetical protein QNJ38_17120 [Prochloraceae cyanobacterium]|nr:hypothetical protein [Prochloraceae cyanobacterium]
MKKQDLFAEKRLKRLELFICLIPGIGLFPALWKLSRKPEDRAEKSISRLAVNLGLIWIVSYSLLWLGATQTSEVVTFRLLYLNGLLTSGYFLICITLMARIVRGKSITLPQMKQNKPEISQKNIS